MKNNSLKHNNIWVHSFVTDGKYLYFVCLWFNVLFCMDIDTGEIVNSIDIPFETPFTSNRVFYMYKRNGNIILLLNKPQAAVARYDICKQSIEIIEATYKNESWGDNADEDEQYIYVPIINKMKIAIISKDDFDVHYIEVASGEKGISSLYKHNDKFYIVTVGTGNLLEINCITNEVRTFENKPNDYKIVQSSYPSSGIFQKENHVVVFARYTNMSVIYDVENNSVEQFGEKFCEADCKDGPIVSSTRKIGDQFVVYKNNLGEWDWYDSGLNCIRKVRMYFGEKVSNYLEKAPLFYKNSSYLERERAEIHTLSKFIMSIMSENDEC